MLGLACAPTPTQHMCTQTHTRACARSHATRMTNIRTCMHSRVDRGDAPDSVVGMIIAAIHNSIDKGEGAGAGTADRESRCLSVQGRAYAPGTRRRVTRNCAGAGLGAMGPHPCRASYGGKRARRACAHPHAGPGMTANTQDAHVLIHPLFSLGRQSSSGVWTRRGRTPMRPLSWRRRSRPRGL
jgi:hypothetical protein